MRFRVIGAAMAAAVACLCASGAAADYVIRDGAGNTQTFASITLDGVQYPKHVLYGLYGGSTIPLSVASDGSLNVNIISGGGGGGGGSLGATANASAQTSTEGATGVALSIDLNRYLRVRSAQDGTWSVGLTGTLPAYAATPTFNLGTLNGAATAANQAATHAAAGSDASSAVAVQGITGAKPIGVSGTVGLSGSLPAFASAPTVNLGTLGGASTAALQSAPQAAAGSDAAAAIAVQGVTGGKAIGVNCLSGCSGGSGGTSGGTATAAAPTYTEGTTGQALSLNLTGDQRVIAKQSGTWSVGITGTPAVTVAGVAQDSSLATLHSDLSGVALDSSIQSLVSAVNTLNALMGSTSTICASAATTCALIPRTAAVQQGVESTATQNVALASPVPAGTNTIGNVGLTGTLPAFASPPAVTVSGVATAAGVAATQGSVAPGTAATTSTLGGCIYKSAGITLTDGQQAALQCDSTGQVKTTGSGGGGGGGALTAGEAHAGEVGGRTAIIGCSSSPCFTNVSATAYSAGQLIANNATAGSVTPMTFTGACRIAAGNGMIRRVRIKVATDTGFAGQLLYLKLYRDSPTVTNGDHGTWLSTDSNYIGTFPVLLDQHFSDFEKGVGAPDRGSEVNFDCASASTAIYGLLVAGGTFTPAGTGKAITIALEIPQN